MEKQGVVYILTNPSFPDYVKIGFTEDIEKRLKDLNRSECTPFAFRLYAYYETPNKLADLDIHKLIDGLNHDLRSIDEVGGKIRRREFYRMSPADAYGILESIAKVSGTHDSLTLVEPSAQAIKDDEEAEKDRIKRRNLPKLDWMLKQGLVKIGDEVCIISRPEAVATIADDKHVNYNGELLSLNVYGCKVMGWSSIQGYAYIKPVNGDKTLAELREERMKELEKAQ